MQPSDDKRVMRTDLGALGGGLARLAGWIDSFGFLPCKHFFKGEEGLQGKLRTPCHFQLVARQPELLSAQMLISLLCGHPSSEWLS